MSVERESREDERRQDIRFFNHIFFEIISYATSNGREPDATLRFVAERILVLLRIASFNGFKEIIDEY